MHHFHLRQCSLFPSSTLIEYKITNPTSTFWGAEMRLWMSGGLWGYMSVLQSPKNHMSMVHSWAQFRGLFDHSSCNFPLLATKDRYCT